MVLMQQVEEGGATLIEAAARMDVSYRQAKRIWRRWRGERAVGLVHRLRGQVSNRRLDSGFKAQVLETYRREYGDFGPTLAAEKMAERNGLAVVAETLRRWLHEAHLWIPRRALRVHRRRRERRKRFGALVQMDGSHHAWFEERAQPCCAMVLVDDATGQTLAHVQAQETTAAAFEALRQWIVRYGLPEALYTDKKSVFYTPRQPSAEEKRLGCGAATDFGRACWRLGIEMIWAGSPQAKGRVERKNGVLQDRLVKEMRLEGIDHIEAANAMLPRFCDDLNRRFARPAASPIDAHRRPPNAQILNDALCREEHRVVQNDWTVHHKSRIYQIEEQPGMPQPKQRVIVRQRLDKTLAILHRDQTLRFTEQGYANNIRVTPPLGAGPATTTQQPVPNRGHF